MPQSNPIDEQALRNLGAHIRRGYANKNPTSEKSLETVRKAVKQDFDQQKANQRQMENPPTGKSKDRKAPGSDKE